MSCPLKRATLLLCLLSSLLFFSCCGGNGAWRGYENEDMSSYITVGTYMGLTYPAQDFLVTDEETETALRSRLAALAYEAEPVDGLAYGDRITFDRFCIYNGESLPELSEQNASVIFENTEDSLLSVLLPAMTGMKIGESAEIPVTLDAGIVEGTKEPTQVIYRVTVLSLLRTFIPACSDENAPSIVPGCHTLAECREAIREQLLSEKEKNAANTAKAWLWKCIMDQTKLKKLPSDLYASRYAGSYDDYQKAASLSGMTLSVYLNTFYQIDEQQLADIISSRVSAEITEALAIYTIAKNEGISHTEEELMRYAAPFLVQNGGTFDSYQDYLSYTGEDQALIDYLRDAVLDLIYKSAHSASEE